MASDPTRISDPAVRALAREVVSLRQELDTVKGGLRASQLGNSSVDNGTLWFTDGGVKRVGIGAQIDGKFGWFAVNGDPPPRPTPPILEASLNGITIGWDGQFVGLAPSDFTHVKAYLSPVGSGFIPSDGNLVGHLLGNAKLPITPLEPGTNYWAVLIAYNTSGVASPPSIVQGPVQPTAVVATEILDGIVTEVKLANDAVTAAKIATGAVGTAQLGSQSVDLSKLADGSVDATKIVDGSITPAKVTFTAQDIGSVATYNQPSQPTGSVPAGSLWFDGSKLRRYSGSAWVELTDAGIANALQAAQQAQTDAANALNTASGAQAAVASKVTVYYQNSSPSGANTGDLWINTGNQNRLSRWSGSAWVAVEDQRIATALVNAQSAQATADGKITAFYQATAPASGMAVGDFWYKSDAGNLPHRWNGTSWVPLPVGSGAIADGAVTTGKIAGNAVDVSKLADGSVNAAKILNGAVVQDKIAANAVGANQIAANAITAGKIAANVVGANELAANSVVAGKIAADAVTATNIVAGSIQAQHIAAAQILAEKIASGAVTAEKIAALAITGDKIDANQITAGHILAGAVTADKLESLLVLASQIIAGDPNDWHLELGDANTPILYWNNEQTGFAVSKDQVTGQANVYMSGRVEFGNGSQIEQDYLDLCEQPSSGFQAPKPRQQRHWIDSGPKQSVTARWTAATQRGNLLLMPVFAASAPGHSVAPELTTPAGWSLVRTVTAGTWRMSLFQMPNHSASRAAETITANRDTRWAIGLFEYSGIMAAALDVSASSFGTGTGATSGTTATTSQAAELYFAAFGSPTIGNTNGKNGQWTAPTDGFTKVLEGDGAAGIGLAVATKTGNAVAPVSTGLTINKSVPWLGIVATFRSATAAGVPSRPPPGVLRLYTRRIGGATTPFVVDDAARTYPVGRMPLCWARLNASPVLPAGANVWAQSDWVSVKDDYGMLSLSTSPSTFSAITIPLDGYYWVDYRSNYGLSSSTGTIAGFVARNSRAASARIAHDARGFRAHGDTDQDGTPVHALRLVSLIAGDQLFWGNFSNVSVTLFDYRWSVPSEIKVTYQGPLH